MWGVVQNIVVAPTKPSEHFRSSRVTSFKAEYFNFITKSVVSFISCRNIISYAPSYRADFESLRAVDFKPGEQKTSFEAS